MSGFKRRVPDIDALRAWLEVDCEKVPGWHAHARRLWERWVDAAVRCGVEAGTPRSFSNELRKLGYGWRRASSMPLVVGTTQRTRFHAGIRLIGDVRATWDDYGFEDYPQLYARHDAMRAARLEWERRSNEESRELWQRFPGPRPLAERLP